MKPLLFILLVLGIQTAQAQVKILTFAEASEQGLSQRKLDSIYRPKGASKGRREGSKSWEMLSKKQFELSRKIFGNRPQQPRMAYSLYQNQAGTFEYMLYEIQGKANKELEVRFIDSLRVLLNNYPLENNPDSPRVSSHFMVLGVVRSIPKGDSTIITLEDAIATTRPDTVKVVALNQLEMKSVPDVIYRFTEMQELNLSGNELKSAAIDLTRLPKLRHIWLNANQLTDTSLHFPLNKTLKVLNVQGNRFPDVPQAIRNCKKLTSLWLGYNKLTQLNENSFKGLRRLQDLNLYSCDLKNLPKGISKLKRLEVLDLYYNELSTLPRNLGRMRRLQQLALSNNQLIQIPTTLGRLKRLHSLYAHHNKLSTLPGSVGKLRSLRILALNNNQFSTLPKQIGSLRVVEEIDISDNNLSEVPAQIVQLRQLKKLYLRKNPFSEDASLLSRSKPVLESLEQNKTDVSY
ncbi:leucine-rich repeat domain-containing protein [Runella sp.]|jgi:Leucine-rich repeat (LRR) protein|uniref:leucine-rich repeat domain-containing protein n=1 Tax=Runella sp. TaxID=1960881 RepID=UPI00262E4351|nr:leucine-rich repeat domain-containing protein [Runella sp.]